MNSTLLWMQSHTKQIKIAAVIVVTLIILYVGGNLIYNKVHDYNYNSGQTKGQKEAQQHETNANSAEINANIAEQKQKELEEHEKEIINQQQTANKQLENDRAATGNSRQALDNALQQNVPDRSDGSGTDDDTLLKDAGTAKNTFDNRRSKAASKRKFRP